MDNILYEKIVKEAKKYDITVSAMINKMGHYYFTSPLKRLFK